VTTIPVSQAFSWLWTVVWEFVYFTNRAMLARLSFSYVSFVVVTIYLSVSYSPFLLRRRPSLDVKDSARSRTNMVFLMRLGSRRD